MNHIRLSAKIIAICTTLCTRKLDQYHSKQLTKLIKSPKLRKDVRRKLDLEVFNMFE